MAPESEALLAAELAAELALAATELALLEAELETELTLLETLAAEDSDEATDEATEDSEEAEPVMLLRTEPIQMLERYVRLSAGSTGDLTGSGGDGRDDATLGGGLLGRNEGCGSEEGDL